MKPLLKKSSLALRALLLLSVMHAGVARAEIMTAAIEAFVSGIDGYYLPSNLKLGDRVSFVYVFDDAETKAHHYYLDGRVQAISMAAYPDLTALSDARSAFSQNLLDTFAEFKGNSGYQSFNSYWVWSVKSNGMRIFSNSISPGIIVYLGHTPGRGLTGELNGHIRLWAADQTLTTVNIEFTSVQYIPGTP
jgi:hypothetical protein